MVVGGVGVELESTARQLRFSSRKEGGTYESFVETVDNNTRRRSVDLDEGVADTVGLDGDIDVSVREGLGGLSLGLGVDTNASEELTTGTGDTVEEEGGRGGDRGVDTVLDGGELRDSSSASWIIR